MRRAVSSRRDKVDLHVACAGALPGLANPNAVQYHMVCCAAMRDVARLARVQLWRATAVYIYILGIPMECAFITFM